MADDDKTLVERLREDFGGEWREIAGTHGAYFVSSGGEIYSAPRKRARGGLLKQWDRGAGYKTVCIRFKDGASKKMMLVHRLVADAFLGEIPDGLEVRHLDGSPSNNNCSNLRIGNKIENEADKALHGTRLRGERTPSAKLNWDQVLHIRASRGKVTQKVLSEMHGVHRTTIQRIQAGQYWEARA